MSDSVEHAAAVIRERTGGLAPKVGIVLGSGLGTVADALLDRIVIPYAELPGFPQPGVESHEGRLVVGHIGGVAAAAMQGRTHYYESGRADAMKEPLQTLAAVGCETLILTSSAGSLRPEVGPGSLMLVTDHINFSGANPLIGATGDARFVDMTASCDPEIGARLLSAAARLGIDLHQGVLVWFAGPNFETPAEVRAARVLGADAVGMSTVPEIILARHIGLRVAAISIITNAAAGMGDGPLSHADSVAEARDGADKMRRLILAFLEALDDAR